MVELTREMYEAGKPVAAICHAGWMLAEAALLEQLEDRSEPSKERRPQPRAHH